jgi:hypothetical protein
MQRDFKSGELKDRWEAMIPVPSAFSIFAPSLERYLIRRLNPAENTLNKLKQRRSETSARCT